MKEDKIKILGIIGPSGCGKDTAARYLADTHPNKYKYVKLHTTRPQRNEEDDGYYFYDAASFLEQILNGNMLNAQEFRGWYYGLHKEALYKEYINVLPMNNEMVQQMIEENRQDYDLKIIYIHTQPKARLLHILNREEFPDCPEVCRRFLTDLDDYENNKELFNYCYKIIENRYNNNFYLDCVLAAEVCFEGD